MSFDLFKLTIKQRAAVEHYLQNGNELAAYVHAYEVKDPTSASTRAQAVRLFKKPKVANAVNHFRKQALEAVNASVVEDAAKSIVARDTRTVIDSAWVLDRASALASFNIRKFLKVVGGVLCYDFTEATEDDWYCISEITLPPTNIKDLVKDNPNIVRASDVKIKAIDKLAALKLVGQHVEVAAFEERKKLEVTIKDKKTLQDFYKDLEEDKE